MVSDTFSSRDRLEEASKHIQRAALFSMDQSTIDNALVRIHFLFDEELHQFSVESAPRGDFILPKYLFEEKVEEKKIKKEKKNFSKQFNKIKSFSDGSIQFSEDIKIVGVASSISKKLITEGEASIFFYPTGEKDEAIVMLASDEEVITIELSPFTFDMKTNYHSLGEFDYSKIDDVIDSKVKEIFEQWLKN